MAAIKRFEDLEVWQLARKLCKEIHDIMNKGSFKEDLNLNPRGQIDRLSGSIMDNIAEGFERGGNREFIQFLSVSKASSAEVRSQLYRAFDRNHISETVMNDLKTKAEIISKKLNALISYLNDSNFKGQKFHEPQEPYGNNDLNRRG